ncbi:MAG: Sec-independent protein translocase protein TatB [Hyphomicrobiaceae bacterium]|nr:Sec-independent protein translocase protein TatB [Hyphomicrobiaceae bacterium]
MFDIGWTELFIIAVVAIIVVGPKDLPRMLRSLGQYAAQLRRTAGEFRSQFDEAIRESELDELRSTLQDASDMNPVNQIKDSVSESLAPLKETADEIKSGMDIKEPTETPKSKEPEGASDSAGKTKKTKAKAAAEKSRD